MLVTGRRATRYALLAAVASLSLAACATGVGSAEPSWVPKPSFSGEGYAPPAQQPAAPNSPGRSGSGGGSEPSNLAPSGGAPSSGGSSSANTKPGDAAVVATRLLSPTGIAILPDNTALVGERTTGRIVRVQPTAGQPVQTVRTLRGIDASGDGGLLDLALSPNYSQDNLIFAYLTTKTDNRVVAFTLTGPVTTVFGGIPRGRTGNTGRIAFAADGSLLVGTGDAGRPALASNPKSLAGKILRITDIGEPAAGNPQRGLRIYASGLRQVDGLCTGARLADTLIVSGRADENADPVFRLQPRANYATTAQPIASLPETSRDPGGCALLDNVAFATSRDGEALLATPIKLVGPKLVLGTWTPALRGKYGRLLTVVAAGDGALWLTTSNRDGEGKPVPTDDRVIRIVPGGGGGGDDGADKV